MKKILSKGISLLLTVAMVLSLVSTSAFAADFSKLKVTDGEVVLDGTNPGTVTVSWTGTGDYEIYGIEGIWSLKETGATDKLKLTEITSEILTFTGMNYVDVPSGKLMWTDDSFDAPGKIAEGKNLISATYSVAADTPAGTYTVTYESINLIGDDAENDLTGGTISFDITVKTSVTPPAHTCTLTKIDAKAATCTEDGNIEYYQCSDPTCGKLYKDAAGTQEITKEDTVIKAAHTGLTFFAAKEPTCTADGCIAYWFCTGCDKYYLDNNGAAGAETTVEKVAIPATGHDWEVIKGADGSNTHTLKCKVCNTTVDEVHAGDDVNKKTWSYDDDYHWHEFGCGTRMDLAEHPWGCVGDMAPTCTREGMKTYHCNVCGHKKTVTIPKVDHQYEWKHDETSHWQECTVCGDIINKTEHTYASHHCDDAATCTHAECGYVKPAGQHKWDDGVVTKEATCAVPGEKTFTCTVCQATKTEPIPTIDHQNEWKSDETKHWQECTVCHNKESEAAHQWSPTNEEPATCTKDGKKDFICMACGRTKTDTIDALGHSMTKTDAKAATCTEPGNSAYYTCGTCGKFFSDVDGKNEIDENSWVINALKHNFTDAWVNTDAAGHYHKCSRCNATDTVIEHTFTGKPCNEADNCTVCGFAKAPGVHAWGAAEYKWGDDNMSCTATVKCTNCEAVETDVAFIGINTTPATCTVDGKTVYTATFYSELFTTQTKEVTIDKLGHAYGEPVWSWSEDGKTATATFTCTREGCTAETTGHAQTMTAKATGKQTVAPTCTDKGTTTYTAMVTFEGKSYTATKDVQDINALGHKLTRTAAKAATCTEPGNNEYWTCSVCNKVFKADKTTETTVAAETLAALGHKMTKTDAVTPTCVAEGTNAYYTCGTCHKVFKDEQGTTPTTVAAEKLAKDPTNHVGGTERRGAVAASCMTAGRTADNYCKSCGKLTVPGTIIQPTGHNYVDGVCTTCGSKQPANGDIIKAAIEKIVADAKEAVEEVLDEAIKNETNASTKKILEGLKGFVSGSSRSKLQAVYNVTMNRNNTNLDNGESLDDAQNVTIAISEETYNALKSGAKIVESYLDANGNAQTREINATLKQVGDGYTVTFSADKTAAYGLVTKTSSGSSGSGGSYTSGKTFTTDLPAGSITSVSVNGKKLDSKYYVISGSNVTLTDAYLATLKAGKYTIKIENATHVSTGTFTITADGALSSPKTADAGIALYAMLAVSSLMGTAVVSKKRRKA